MIKCKMSCPLGKFGGCCVECPEKDSCNYVCKQLPDDCGTSIKEGTDLKQVFKEESAIIIRKITETVIQKKEAEEAEKKLREQLQGAMEQYGVDKFENDLIKITYVAATTKTSVDSAKMKKEAPETYALYSKTSPVSAFVKIEVK